MSCVDYQIEVIKTVDEIDPLAFALCFVFGMLFGAAVFLILAWFCLREKLNREVN